MTSAVFFFAVHAVIAGCYLQAGLATLKVKGGLAAARELVIGFGYATLSAQGLVAGH